MHQTDPALYWLLAIMGVAGTFAVIVVGINFMNSITHGQAVENMLRRFGASQETIARYWQKRIEQEEEYELEPPLTKRQYVQMQGNVLAAGLIVGAVCEWFIHTFMKGNLQDTILFAGLMVVFVAAFMTLNYWLYRKDQQRLAAMELDELENETEQE